MAWVPDTRMPRPESPRPSPRVATECRRLAEAAATRRRGLLPRAGTRCISSLEPEVAAGARRQLREEQRQQRAGELATARAALEEAADAHARQAEAVRARASALETQLAQCAVTPCQPSRWRRSWCWREEAEAARAAKLAAKLEPARREAAAAAEPPHTARELQHRHVRAAESRLREVEAAAALDIRTLHTVATDTWHDAAVVAAARAPSPPLGTNGVPQRRVEGICTRPAYAT
mmetsp:Transcript_62051/g.200071  ORF Transcript_62051/g.200071 Transcript_62051/m.200071 type:complete len:234 (-) Transcript_62051:204-905(-)